MPLKKVIFGDDNSKIILGSEASEMCSIHNAADMIAFAITISDNLPIDQLTSRIEYAKSLAFDDMSLDALNIKFDSENIGKYIQTACLVFGLWDKPIILECNDIDAISEIFDVYPEKNPLVYAAEESNFEDFISLSIKTGWPLVLKSFDLEKLADMAEYAEEKGAQKIVLDIEANNLKNCLEKQVAIRRSATIKGFVPLSYPTMNRVGSGEFAVAMAAVSIARYGSLVVFDNLQPYEAYPLFSLRKELC